MVHPALHEQVARDRHADLIRAAEGRRAVVESEPARRSRRLGEPLATASERILEPRTFFIARSGSAA